MHGQGIACIGAGMENPALERAIDALGGPTPTSHALVVSYWTIRQWRKAGRVRDSKYAVLLARAAQAAGADVTVGQLAGLDVTDTCDSTPPEGKGGKKGGLVTPATCRESPVALAARHVAALASPDGALRHAA